MRGDGRIASPLLSESGRAGRGATVEGGDSRVCEERGIGWGKAGSVEVEGRGQWERDEPSAVHPHGMAVSELSTAEAFLICMDSFLLSL